LNAVTGLLLLPMLLLAFPNIAQAAERKPPSDAAKIANAMTAAPMAVSRNAAIAEMNGRCSTPRSHSGHTGLTLPDAR
jgi:hypothetical protein